MKKAILATLVAGLAMGTLPALAQDASATTETTTDAAAGASTDGTAVDAGASATTDAAAGATTDTDAATSTDGSAGASTDAAATTTEGEMTEDTPISVEIAIGGLSDDAKMSAAASAAETATEARIVYVSELQTGPTNATVEDLRLMAEEKAEALDKLRETLTANTSLTGTLEEAGGLDHVVSVALDQDGMLLIFVDDEHEM